MALELVGRERELQAAADFLTRLDAGPASLVFAGEAGIGKTTVWEAAAFVARQRGYQVLTARPAEPDRSLSFAGLADLLAEVELERFDLPEPQWVALDAALLRSDNVEGAPDARAVFTAVRSIVTAISERQPVILAVDDVQWLDPPSLHALQFVARRLGDQQVGVLLSLRAGHRDADDLLAGVGGVSASRIEIGPLTLAATHQMLKRRLEHTFPRPTLLRIQQASGGNPFFALEIARAIGATELRPDEPLPVPADVRLLVRRRIERLPHATRRVLLRAAALSQPTAALLGAALDSAWTTDLLRELPDGTIAFVHPLYASAVYETASPHERHRIHRELAAVVPDIEQRARHLALAATGPDERLAAELDRAAARARSRGAPEIAAELQDRALELTPPEARIASGERALAAAEHYFHAGALSRARQLLTATLERLEERTMRVHALRLLAHVRFREESIPEAVDVLMRAVAEAGDEPQLRAPLEFDLIFALVSLSQDHEKARPHVEALRIYAENLADRALLAEALAVEAMINFLLGGGVDEEKVARALALEDLDHHVHAQFRPTLIAGFLALYTGRLDEARSLLNPLRERLRDRGEEGELPLLLGPMCWLESYAGDCEAAERLATEAIEVATLTESETLMAWSLAFAALGDAYAGRVDSCRARIGAAQRALEHAGYGLARMWVLAALGLLELSLANAQAAWNALEPLTEFVERSGVVEPIRAFFLPDAIEALIGLGDVDRAEHLAGMLADRGRELDRPWALATAYRCRALVHAAHGDLNAALSTIGGALDEHERLAMPLEHGRTLLVRGQIERRARQKAAAKESVEQALTIFRRIGAAIWIDRAVEELNRLALRHVEGDELTESERRIAHLAGSGLTNRDIAARLFISPKTVEAHLGRVYRKLDIRSRAELAAMVATSAQFLSDLLDQM
jgi:DNA-binding CsgD family transcriptional regulator